MENRDRPVEQEAERRINARETLCICVSHIHRTFLLPLKIDFCSHVKRIGLISHLTAVNWALYVSGQRAVFDEEIAKCPARRRLANDIKKRDLSVGLHVEVDVRVYSSTQLATSFHQTLAI